jgi:hypothetical protein
LELLPRHLLLSPAARADDQQRQPINAPAALIGDSAHNAAQGAPAAPLAEVAKRNLERFMTHTQAGKWHAMEVGMCCCCALHASCVCPHATLFTLACVTTLFNNNQTQTNCLITAAPPPPSIAPLRVNMPASGAAARLAALGQPFADTAATAAAAAAPWPIPAAAAGNAAARARAPLPPSSRGGGVMHAAAAPPSAPPGSNMLALATWQWAEAVAALAQQQQQPCFGMAGQINSFMAAGGSPAMINASAALMAMHPPPSAPRPALPPPAQPATSRHLWLGNVRGRCVVCC